MEYRKKLIEVALPLEAINAASAREKSIRHGHPSTLHLWWARRPLAACRAVLFASLVDDPSSDRMFGGDEDIEASKRAELFNLIEELVLWENSNNPRVINKARAEIARCIASRKIETGELKKDEAISLPSPACGRGAEGEGGENRKAASKTYTPHDIKHMLASREAVNHFLATYGPSVLDPFCGGGSIPLEAQRLGLRAYGSDLNPVAVLITKALIEIPPMFADLPPVNSEWHRKSREEKAAAVWEGSEGLAEDVRCYGKWMCKEATKRIGRYYPKITITKEMAQSRPDLTKYVGQDLTIIAWLWARTVASPNPICRGAHVPLIRSFWLSTKKSKGSWLKPIIDREGNKYEFTVGTGTPPDDFCPANGTVNRSGAKCLLSEMPIPFEYIREEGKAGRINFRLTAIVAEGVRERLYLSPEQLQEAIAMSVNPTDIPDTPLPEQALGFRVQLYGMTHHRDLFTNRQLLALATYSGLICEARQKALADAKSTKGVSDLRCLEDGGIGAVAYADAVALYLAFALSKVADRGSTLTRWMTGRDSMHNTFARQALPMIWDFVEVNAIGDQTGGYAESLKWTLEVLDSFTSGPVGTVQQHDAAMPTITSPTCVSTDPPYYDNIGYADLSDFFYVWLRKSLGGYYPGLFPTVLTPKTQELIATPFRFEGSKERAYSFFEVGLGQAFQRMRESQEGDFPVTVFYAFKQTESDEDEDGEDDDTNGVSSTGWETMLEGLIRAKFTVTGTWPMRSERGNRPVASGTNALASSIVLVCRSRPQDAPLASRKEFIVALRKELPTSLRDLQRGSIAPVDLAQAAIGPGMAVFTRFSQVMETDGSPMTVRTALGLINQALDEVLAEQEGEFDTDTRWALAWFEQFGMDEGPFGVAETLSKAKNTAVNGLVQAGVAKARGGKVQLLTRDELLDDWEPSKDKRLTIWELTQYLIRTLEQKGESGAAALLHKLGGLGETARDLAYRLYTICERKKWADDALAYNGLVIAWPELTKLAQAERSKSPGTQTRMFE